MDTRALADQDCIIFYRDEAGQPPLVRYLAQVIAWPALAGVMSLFTLGDYC